MSLSLPDVVDLEVRLHLDRDVDPDQLHARDRALGVDGSGETAVALRAWLHALQQARGGPSTGEQVATAARLLTAGLFVVGLAVGWGATAALFAYDGARPINVLPFVGVVVGLQGLAAMVSVLGLVLARVSPGVMDALPLWRDLRFGMRWMLRVAVDRVSRGQHLHDDVASVWGRLRGRRGLYAPLEAWLAFGLVQSFATAVNLGVLANALRLVSLTDLAFGWGTTLELGAATFHDVLTGLSLPFAAFVPSAVPSLEMVQATQFSRMSRAFVDPAGVQLAPAWWRFLVAATVTWGLLPRLVLGVVARVGLWRARAAVPLDTPEVARVLARLRTPRLAAGGDDAHAEPGLPMDPGPQPCVGLTAAAVVRWGDLPGDDDRIRARVIADVGAQVTAVRAAGGRDYAVDAATLAALGDLGEAQGVVVVAEAFEQPDRALRLFLTDCREIVGAGVPVVVGLVGDGPGRAPAADDVVRWRSMVSALADPYLDVVGLGGGA